MAVPVKPIIEAAKPYVKKVAVVVGKYVVEEGIKVAQKKMKQYQDNKEEQTKKESR